MTIVVIFLIFTFMYVRHYVRNIPVPALKIERTQARLERGKYLATHVMVCLDCHSKRDWTKYSAPVIPGTEGQGGERFDQLMGITGYCRAENITPYNLFRWSDGEIYRAITSGLSKEGKPLLPVMPYSYFGKLSTEDIYSVIAYIRTLPSVKGPVTGSNSSLNVSLMLYFLPQKPQPADMPPPGDTIGRGRYLAVAGGCIECHTKINRVKSAQELVFAGGRDFRLEKAVVISKNITPDTLTGIGRMTQGEFIHKFRSRDLSTWEPPTVSALDTNTVMPWTAFAGLDTSDLKALYTYLHSRKPVRQKVIAFKRLN
jgi:mono/diheme cytochrome c family protein